MSHRIYNFCSGPAMLPTEVMEQAQADLLDWKGLGMSVMELSHRSDAFTEVLHAARKDLKTLLDLGDDFEVLFLQGGASLQFSAIPLNLGGDATADYIDTGIWSRKAIAEAGRYIDVNVAASAESNAYTHIPGQRTWRLQDDAAYVHITPNETIGGLEYHWIPDTGGAPLVADMSSTILSRPIPTERFGVIYAGAQKNIGPAGLTLVIVRKDLLGQARLDTPTLLNWQTYAENDSMPNTPPTFAIYLAGLVFRWISEQGGLSAMAACNQRKADKLYDFIDGSDFYANPIAADSRSWMNIPFTLREDSMNADFLHKAEAAGLANLQGHRSVGGMRASIYNAMPEAGVDRLIEFMSDFAGEKG